MNLSATFIFRFKETRGFFRGTAGAKRNRMRTEADLNRIAAEIIAAGIAVHKAIGPGCFESAYNPCVAYELHQRRLAYEMKVPVTIEYEGLSIPRAFEADFIVESDIVLELKATSAITAVDARQLLTYLRFTGCPLGLLMNFGSLTLVDGIKRVVNNFPEGSKPSGTHERSLRTLREI